MVFKEVILALELLVVQPDPAAIVQDKQQVVQESIESILSRMDYHDKLVREGYKFNIKYDDKLADWATVNTDVKKKTVDLRLNPSLDSKDYILKFLVLSHELLHVKQDVEFDNLPDWKQRMYDASYIDGKKRKYSNLGREFDAHFEMLWKQDRMGTPSMDFLESALSRFFIYYVAIKNSGLMKDENIAKYVENKYNAVKVSFGCDEKSYRQTIRRMRPEIQNH